MIVALVASLLLQHPAILAGQFNQNTPKWEWSSPSRFINFATRIPPGSDKAVGACVLSRQTTPAAGAAPYRSRARSYWIPVEGSRPEAAVLAIILVAVGEDVPVRCWSIWQRASGKTCCCLTSPLCEPNTNLNESLIESFMVLNSMPHHQFCWYGKEGMREFHGTWFHHHETPPTQLPSFQFW